MALFNKILIANRGEIACRIIKTAKRLGIKTVAVFSQADAKAQHVKLADQAFLLGPAPSKASYLNIEKIISIAKASGATAIHPGYGFLSENPDFAMACEQANITFIGPSSTAIALMANKHLAKEKMQAQGIPVLLGVFDQSQSIAMIHREAKKIGFPVLLKAVAGGGGKGLRLVNHESELEHAFQAVKREAKAFFNDEKILIEKYLAAARHVEVQIIGDNFGKVHHLLTRDCSIQRRHQKIVEEAPTPNISLELQEQMTTAAIKIAQAIQYTNAGTVEFLLEQDQFYFMEMNTRLQVEHPVTEMITAIDLVEWQIRIAAGQPLFKDQPKFQGHAVEVRLNAEDPDRDYLPSSGIFAYFKLPNQDKNVRVDCGYQTGDEVNIYYDSLIAKIIVWGENRSLAITALKHQLDEIEILGLRTNLALLKNIITNKIFLASTFNTLFLQKDLSFNKTDLPTELLCIASIYLANLQQHQSSKNDDQTSPWNCHNGWQLFQGAGIKFKFLQSEALVDLKRRANSFTIIIENKQYHCTLLQQQQLPNAIVELNLLINDQYHQAKIFKDASKLEIIFHQQTFALEVLAESSSQSHHEHDERLIAPMPGTLVAQLVTSGQAVNKGDKLVVIEAMKMEHTLFAPRDGKIKQCHFKIGDLVKEGAELLEFE